MNTRKRRLSGLAGMLLALLALAGLAACGGGGSGGGGGGGDAEPDGPTQLALLKAKLLGSLETTVIDADARGAAFVEVWSDGTLEFATAGETEWVPNVIGAHIHKADPGVDGPIVVNLLQNGAVFDPDTGVASDTLEIDPALAEAIANDPASYYLNVHTSAASEGLVRGQLSVMDGLEAHAVLRGSEEVDVEDPDARGAATVHVASDRTVTWRIGMTSPDLEDVQSAHIHAAPAGVNGTILVDFETSGETIDSTTGLLGGSRKVDWSTLARIYVDLSQYYINAHTQAAPGGIARGQLTDGPAHVWATLRAGEETIPPNDSTGQGGATIQMHSFSSGTAHLAVPADQGITTVIGAHLHAGVTGESGPSLVNLMAGSDFTVSPISFSSEGSIELTQDTFTRVLANPRAHYVSIKTNLDTAGAARGQLTQSQATFTAELNGVEVSPIVDDTAHASLDVVVTDIFKGSFALEANNPPPPDVTEAHVHDGAFGADGPELIDLMGSGDTEVSGRFITGSINFTGRTFARLLAWPEGFHADVHTATSAPGAIARGQFARLADELPPDGLTYESPVTYSEQSEIEPNIPSSSGGAIQEYSVSPDLPAGLSLDSSTGAISGTPTAAASAADYTVTATNATGSTTATVNIEVLPLPPTNLQYTSPVTYSTNNAISPNNPTNDGGAITSYSVSPSLPSGLSLDASTGVISGTPTSASSAANYTVTGSNAAGSTTATINITVNAVLTPPSNLSYTSPVSYSTGSAITPNTPTVGGGAVSSWGISPSLPSGLLFDMSTGVISGTPTKVTSAANYTVTASNSAGSTTATVNITVTLGAPTNLSYSNNPNIAYVNTPIASMSPTSSGGSVSSYSVSPSLPSGISINPSTGVISGTPTTQSKSTNYTVTATNSAGSTTATISIIVY